MSLLLTVLNDLSWVIESAAMDHMGEGKFELSILCKKLRADPAYAVEGTEIADELEAARAAYVAGDERAGAHKLTEVSRGLWKLALTGQSV